MTKAQKEIILSMRKQKVTYAAISQKIGVPVNTIKTFCRRNKMVTDAAKSEPVCKNCGRKLTNTPGSKPRLFCSDACKQAWWNKHRTERVSANIVQVTCLTCKEQFFDYSGANRKFCSLACYHKREVQHGD